MTGRGGKRLAFYFALNLEWFSFGEGLGAELAPGGPHPDVLNYAWRDYGNRVGVFRLAELFAELQAPVSLLVNARMVSTRRRRSPLLPAPRSSATAAAIPSARAR